MLDNNIDRTTVYPDLTTAAKVVCLRWCQEHGYCEPFCLVGEWWAYPVNGVMPVKVRDVMDIARTKAQRVRIRYFSIALLPDGSLAPHSHPELDRA
ncbi:hypothetical protein [Myxosarcina sp. GI1]|uniref:hypothetical protein n=1 Tax=Myxosarcina sp. GI1 TaxID=1541065 RepID=UPI00055D8B15|nr:hypothetical protein [Myxosarcina sp. GI1]